MIILEKVIITLCANKTEYLPRKIRRRIKLNYKIFLVFPNFFVFFVLFVVKKAFSSKAYHNGIQKQWKITIAFQILLSF